MYTEVFAWVSQKVACGRLCLRPAGLRPQKLNKNLTNFSLSPLIPFPGILVPACLLLGFGGLRFVFFLPEDIISKTGASDTYMYMLGVLCGITKDPLSYCCKRTTEKSHVAYFRPVLLATQNTKTLVHASLIYRVKRC